MNFIRSLIITFCFVFTASAYAQSALDDIRFTVNKYEIIGNNPLGQKAYKVIAPFLGDQYGLEGLSAAADALEQALNKKGYSFHRVSLPPQELFGGSVILEIVEFKVGQIKVTGNKFFSNKNILRSLPAIKSGITPNTKEVSNAVKTANQNASKNIVLRFNEGEEPNTIDIGLNVTDSKPQTFFVSLDNTGGYQSKESRMTLGYQHANVLNKDHSMTFTITTSPEDTESATQMGISYQIPFYKNASKLNILFSDSESNSGTVGDNNLVTGKGNVLGVTYSKSLFNNKRVEQSWSVGASYKAFDDEVFGTESKVLSLPIELGYNAIYRKGSSALSAGATFATNLGIGDNNDDDAYAAKRVNATNSWSVLRYHVSLDLLFAQSWLLHMDLNGQFSGDYLIPGEQYGVGGATSLRGFEERSITGDSGYNYRIELWVPPFTSYQIRGLVFTDMAHVDKEETNSTLDDGLNEDLSSFGFGLRWSWKQNFNVNVDYGKIIEGGGVDTTVNQDDDDKFHISMVYRF